MKRFCIKFCLLFLLIDGFIGFYHFGIQPNLTGDMGELGQIPFGQEYTKRVNATYPHECQMVQNISPEDSITASLVTLGDSFSQQGERGYSQFLAELLHSNIQNIQHKETPEQTLIQLLNHDKIKPQTTVLLEVVERNMILWMCWVNFDDTTRATFREPEEKEERNPNDQRVLQNALRFLKKSVGIQQTIFRFPTSRELFTHSKRKHEIFIYDSPNDNDGDLRFTQLTEKDIFYGYQNMYALHRLAESKGVNLVVLIAADKYDVYEPFIMSPHPHNPTLDSCPDEPWIINTKPLLQSQAYAGTKDLYYLNDTHWSPVGARLVAEEIYRKLSADSYLSISHSSSNSQ